MTPDFVQGGKEAPSEQKLRDDVANHDPKRLTARTPLPNHLVNSIVQTPDPKRFVPENPSDPIKHETDANRATGDFNLHPKRETPVRKLRGEMSVSVTRLLRRPRGNDCTGSKDGLAGSQERRRSVVDQDTRFNIGTRVVPSQMQPSHRRERSDRARVSSSSPSA